MTSTNQRLFMFSNEWFEYLNNNDITPPIRSEGSGFYTGDAAIVYDFEASEFLNKDIYRVVKGFTYVCENQDIVVIPEGYLTDGASIPRIFRGIINPWGRHGRASIVHDLLCDFAVVIDGKSGKMKTVSDNRINDIFLEAMDTDTVTRLKKKVIITSVRAYFKWFRPTKVVRPIVDEEALKRLYRRRVDQT